MTDKKTKHLNLPLPDVGNALAEDCPRLAEALTSLDSHAQAADGRLDSVEIRASALESTTETMEANLDAQKMYDVLDAKYQSLDGTEAGELSVSIQLVNSMILARSQKEHPIGSYYTSDKGTEPSEIFGFGTWERVKGVFLFGADDDTYTAGSEGGEAKHTLTLAESVKHGHNVYVYTGSNPSDGMEAHHWSADGTTAEVAPNGATFSHTWCSGSFKSWGATTMAGGGDPAGTTNALGGSQPHNNMPPYRVVYCWRRTA